MTNVRHPSETFYRFLGPKHRCAYCGEISDTIDHTTPRWFVDGHTLLLQRYWIFKVAACLSCNVLAGDVVDRTFYARKRRIAGKLFRRGRRLLHTADWPKEDLDELGYGMRTFCEQSHQAATVLRRRLRFLADPGWPHDVPLDLQVPHVTPAETFNAD